MSNAKIDNTLFLELSMRGLSRAELARYFDVSPQAVRSKTLTLAKTHPELLHIAKEKLRPNASIPVGEQISQQVNFYLSELNKVQKTLSTIKTEKSIATLDARVCLILKGLQILEKVQKLTGPTKPTSQVTLQSVTQILASPPPDTNREKSVN